MEVQEIMTAKVITVGQDEPVTAAARLLRRWNLGALPVTDSTGRLRGVLTDRDIVLRCLAAGITTLRYARFGGHVPRGRDGRGPATACRAPPRSWRASSCAVCPWRKTGGSSAW